VCRRSGCLCRISTAPSHCYPLRAPTFAALQVVSQARKRRHQRVVLHALALLPPQSPSAGDSLLLLAGADDALSGPVPPLDSWRLVRGASEDGGDRRMRPSRMLAHGRRDGNTFGDHESYGVDRDGNGASGQARSRFVQSRSRIVFASNARHGGGDVVAAVRMRQSIGCSERVVKVVGTSATMYAFCKRHASSEKATA
jgi:hypothetical protein